MARTSTASRRASSEASPSRDYDMIAVATATVAQMDEVIDRIGQLAGVERPSPLAGVRWPEEPDEGSLKPLRGARLSRPSTPHPTLLRKATLSRKGPVA